MHLCLFLCADMLDASSEIFFCHKCLMISELRAVLIKYIIITWQSYIHGVYLCVLGKYVTYLVRVLVFNN